MWRLRMAVLLLLALLAVAFFVLDLGQYLSLAWLQQQRASLQLLVSGQPGLTASGYFVLYVLVCALSVPGAAVLTLAGGALFGFGWGLLLVSFASSFGATLAFWSARYVLGGWVQERFATQLKVVNQGLENDGALYLLTLRLLPLVPFFVVNLALGLTRIPVRTFYVVSQVGMLPGTAVFVNVGTQLAAVDALAGVPTLPVLAAWSPLILRRLSKPKPRCLKRTKWVGTAMKHGIGLNKILATIHTYPTLAESTKYAAGAWKRAHQPKHLLRWAERWHNWRRG